MQLQILKAIHIIGVVSWFAGLFYIFRLFIYDVESSSKEVKAQLRVMQRRLWFGITWPAAVVTVGSGAWLATLLGAWFEGWFHAKSLGLVGLIFYHFFAGRLRQKLSRAASRSGPSSYSLRIWNEVATVLLVWIVFIVETRHLALSAAVTGGLVLVLGLFFLLKSRR